MARSATYWYTVVPIMRYPGDQMCGTFSTQAALEAQVKAEQQSTAGLAGILATIEQGQGEREKFIW